MLSKYNTIGSHDNKCFIICTALKYGLCLQQYNIFESHAEIKWFFLDLIYPFM